MRHARAAVAELRIAQPQDNAIALRPLPAAISASSSCSPLVLQRRERPAERATLPAGAVRYAGNSARRLPSSVRSPRRGSGRQRPPVSSATSTSVLSTARAPACGFAVECAISAISRFPASIAPSPRWRRRATSASSAVPGTASGAGAREAGVNGPQHGGSFAQAAAARYSASLMQGESTPRQHRRPGSNSVTAHARHSGRELPFYGVSDPARSRNGLRRGPASSSSQSSAPREMSQRVACHRS